MKDELLTIKQGIINEIEGYEFYKMAEKQTENKEAIEALNALAEEEMLHVGYLKELYNKMKTSDEDDITFAFSENPPSPKIFDWNKITFPTKSLAVSIYGTAVTLEKASIDFYEKAKKEASHHEVIKVYDLLIKWEKAHLEQFQKAYELNMEQWWDEQGFAPF